MKITFLYFLIEIFLLNSKYHPVDPMFLLIDDLLGNSTFYLHNQYFSITSVLV
jgi:hypothetical protein